MRSQKVMSKVLASILVVFLLSICVPVQALGEHTPVELSFKSADVRDVLRMLSELAGVNLITDSSVQGELTIHLADITFKEALRYITFANNLEYELVGNTYIVASPERLHTMVDRDRARIFYLQFAVPEALKEIIEHMVPNVSVQVDNRLEALIVNALEQDMEEVEYLIKELDTEKSAHIHGKDSKVYFLDYGDAEEMASILRAIIPEASLEVDQRLNALVAEGKKIDIQRLEQFVMQLDQPDRIKADEDRAHIFYLEYAEPQELKAVLEPLVPDVIMEVDHRLHALVVYGKESDVKRLDDLVWDMDAPKPLISVEVRVEEISRTDLDEMGVSAADLANIRFIQGEDLFFDDMQLDLPSLLRMLEDKGASRNLASPRLTTVDGVKGKLLIGDRIPIGEERVETEEGVQITVSYHEVGILIEFLPRVSGEKYITLEIRPEVSTLGETLIEGYPTIKTREAETVVRIESGETIAIGGLIQSQEISSMSRVPFLSELPVLGELFKRSQDEDKDTELIIFITPEIIPAPERIRPISEEPEIREEIEVETEEEEVETEEEDRKESIQEDDPEKPEPLSREEERQEMTESAVSQEETEETSSNYLDDWMASLEKGEQYYESYYEEDGSVYLITSDGEKVEIDPSDVADGNFFFQYSRTIEGITIEYHVTYEVREGDSLWAIGQRYGIPHQWIQEINHIAEGQHIHRGDILSIPILDSHLYTVQEGDTLQSIAETYNVDIATILDLNKLDHLVILPVGQRLIMPRAVPQ